MAIRRETAEHLFSTISLDGATHFLCNGLKIVRTEMNPHVLAYNLRWMMATIGVGRLRTSILAAQGQKLRVATLQ